MKKTGIFLVLMLGFLGMVSAQSITVTAPQKGDVWVKGKLKTISWQKKGSMNSAVKIRLYDSSGSSKLVEISNNTANDGTFKWLVPESVAEGQYVIRVRTIDNKVLDDSDIFSIKSGMSNVNILVNHPSTGERLCRGNPFVISWSRSGRMSGQVNIALYNEAGTGKVADIATNVPNNDQYRWIVPSKITPGNYTVQIKTVDNQVLGKSGVFPIASCGGGIQMLPPKLEQLPSIKTDVLAESNTMYLMPAIKSFSLLKRTIAEGEKVSVNLDLRNADEAHIKEYVTGKEHPVVPLIRGAFTGVFAFTPTSRGTTRLTLIARNRLGENKKECSLEIIPKPVIDKFEVINSPMVQGQKPRFLVSYRSAESARLEDADENITVRAFNGVPSFNGEVEGSPLNASRTPYLFRLVVSGKGGLTSATKSTSVTVRQAESFEKAVIAEFYASPRQVVSPMDQSAFHYRYSRSQSAYIVNLETGLRTILPVSTGEIKGSISLAVPFTSNYKLAVSNQYGAVEKFETVVVKNHPGPVVQTFTARRVGSGYDVQIGYEVWGAVKIEIFRARSTEDSNKVSVFTASGKEPLKGTLQDDPLYFPVVYELRASFPRGRTDRRFQTIKK